MKPSKAFFFVIFSCLSIGACVYSATYSLPLALAATAIILNFYVALAWAVYTILSSRYKVVVQVGKPKKEEVVDGKELLVRRSLGL